MNIHNKNQTKMMPHTGDQTAFDFKINEINRISSIAKQQWIALISYLIFILATLVGVEHVDFLVPSKSTELPFVGVSIPTQTFFYFGPLFALLLFCYLHFYLLKLWGAVKNFNHGQPHELHSSHISSWLINDYAISLKEEKDHESMPLRRAAHRVSHLLLFCSTPFILIFFWWQSIPAQSSKITLLIGAYVLLSLYTAWRSWCFSKRNIGIEKRNCLRALKKTLESSIWLLLAALVITFSWYIPKAFRIAR